MYIYIYIHIYIYIYIHPHTHRYIYIVHARASSTILPRVRALELAQRFVRRERFVGRWCRPLRARLAPQRDALRVEACKEGRPVGQSDAQLHSLMHVFSPDRAAVVSATCEDGEDGSPTCRALRPAPRTPTQPQQPRRSLATTASARQPTQRAARRAREAGLSRLPAAARPSCT